MKVIEDKTFYAISLVDSDNKQMFLAETHEPLTAGAFLYTNGMKLTPKLELAMFLTDKSRSKLIELFSKVMKEEYVNTLKTHKVQIITELCEDGETPDGFAIKFTSDNTYFNEIRTGHISSAVDMAHAPILSEKEVQAYEMLLQYRKDKNSLSDDCKGWEILPIKRTYKEVCTL